MALVAARATRLPIYSSFAKEGNLSDLFAKGEAISTVFNVLGIGAGIQLASTVCSSMQGKVLVLIATVSNSLNVRNEKFTRIALVFVFPLQKLFRVIKSVFFHLCGSLKM